MSIVDKQIGYVRQRMYLPAVSNSMWAVTAEDSTVFDVAHNLGATPGIVALSFSSWDADDTADWAPGTHTAANAVGNIGGDATVKAMALCGIAGKEISTFGFPGVQMLVSDVVGWCRRVPMDFDPNWPLGFRVHFTSASATAADDFQFTVAFDIIAAPTSTAAAGTTLAAASTALDTVIAAQTWIDTTTYKNTWSPRGIKDANWSTRTVIEDGAAMVISLTATVADTAAILLGLEIDYVPRWTLGYSGRETDAPLEVSPA